MTRAYWNGSCEDWLHGDEHWSQDIAEEADDADEYLPVSDEELRAIIARVKARTLKSQWLRLKREFPAIEVTQ